MIKYDREEVLDMKLWTNGFFHTLEDEHKVYTSVVTQQGHIISFNPEDYNHFDEIVDLKGAHVYPGFVDAHLHILGYGEKLNQVSLTAFENKQDILDLIKRKLSEGYMTFYGLSIDEITTHDLNLISTSKPIIIKYHDYHSYIVNDVVLKRANIISNDGKLDLEDMIKVNQLFLSYTKNDLVHLINQSIESLYQFGITGGHSDDLHYFNGYFDTLDAFKESLSAHPFRTHLLIHYLELDKHIASKNPFLDINKYLQLGAVKVFFDGTLGSKTAFLYHPYKDSNTYGRLEMDQQSFIQIVKKVRTLDMSLAIHVIGDQALDQLIDILKLYPPKKGLHDRLIHASFVSNQALKALKDMPIIIDIQPQFIESDFPEGFKLFSKYPEKIYPFQSFLNHQVTICGSSDAPVEIPNPMLGMYHAVTRNGLNDCKDNDDEKINRFEALKLYTTYANIPTYHSHNRGLIKLGYIADFTVFDQDLLSIDIKLLKTIKPIMTIVDEHIVYNKKDFK